ncbi:MAG TPA: hypothetical protein VME42_02260 [Steroidobacteraceae bacterium]|nr:hypothetical protein [Steroidobacteraceae bacterium]
MTNVVPMRSHNQFATAFLVGCLSLAGGTNADDSSVDPPERNPHPTQRVELHVSAPPSLKIRIGADYRVGTWLGMFGGGGEYCGPDVHARPDAIGHALPGTTVPIELKWNGSAYQGSFFLDNFLPGRCHWQFSSLDTLSPANGSVSLYKEYATKYNFDTSHSHGVYDQSRTQSVDLWCAADPSPGPPESGGMLCTSLDYFAVYPGSVANELLATVPVAERVHTSHVNMFLFTSSVTLRFHDLDAENRTASSASARDHFGLPKKCPIDGVRLNVDKDGVITVNGNPVERSAVSKYLQRLNPSPTLACYSLAGTARRSLVAAISVIEDTALIDLPLEAFADNTVTTPVKFKEGSR